jgi:hypothetical protein
LKERFTLVFALWDGVRLGNFEYRWHPVVLVRLVVDEVHFGGPASFERAKQRLLSV